MGCSPEPPLFCLLPPCPVRVLPFLNTSFRVLTVGQGDRSRQESVAMDTPQDGSAVSSRILSVDIFRGLTILVMIFVNDIAGVKGLPWWTYHLPAEVDGMTYVDMVFPAFLFIVGMSIPLAIRRRIEKGDTLPRLWIHVIIRSLSLVVLGLMIANGGKVDLHFTGISSGLWSTMAFVAAILFWNVYPRSGKWKSLSRILKYAGLVLIILLIAIFRRKTADGRAAWLDFSYVEILGLIGWAYLSVCILYVPLRKKLWAPALLLVALCTLNVFVKLGLLDALRQLPSFVWPFGNGALTSITMAGVVASTIFLDSRLAGTSRAKAFWALAYAAALLAGGQFLAPLGISKIRATPTWCLYCAGANTLMFLALFWLLDVRRLTRWAAFVKPAGSNALLTYLLPFLFYAVFGQYYFAFGMGQGWPGAARSLLFSIFILGLAAGLTRLKLRMQL